MLMNHLFEQFCFPPFSGKPQNDEGLGTFAEDSESVKPFDERQLSPILREELRKLGMPLLAYSNGQIESARIACMDGQLIADPDGDNFDDMLDLDDDEIAAQLQRLHPSLEQINVPFTERLHQEREQWRRIASSQERMQPIMRDCA